MIEGIDVERYVRELADENERLRVAIQALGRATGTTTMLVDFLDDDVPGRGRLVLCFPQGDEMAALATIAGIVSEMNVSKVGAVEPLGTARTRVDGQEGSS